MSDDHTAWTGGPLDEVLAAARRHESALILALRTGDSIVGLVAAARLRAALRRAVIALESLVALEPGTRPVLVSVFEQFTQSMYDLLHRTPMMLGRGDPRRLERWFLHSAHSPLGDGPHVFELDSSGGDLEEARFLGVHVLDCRFITKLCRASFMNALVDRCDFTYGDLRSTVWQHTRIVASYFREGSFADAAFERTTFIDCDLRGMDLSANESDGYSTYSDIEFIRCDLRDVHWQGRDLSLLRLLDC
ncbi:MAG: hypothetical protein ABIY55_12665, partial [Kofleriaceae bacterium]